MLNHIVHFDISMTILKELGLAQDEHFVKEQLNLKYGWKECSDKIMMLCFRVVQKLLKDEKKDAKLLVLKEMFDAEEEDEEKCLCLKLLQIFSRKVENTSLNTEQTYVESVLLPFFNLYFDTISCAERYSCRGRLEPLSAQSALLEPLLATTTSSKRKNASASTYWLALQPDYLLKLLYGAYRFDVFCAEFKKPNANITQLVSDEAKLANLLKIMLDRLVLFGVPSPVVCGLIEDGTYLKTYKMMIGDDGKYDFVQLSNSKSIACVDDLLRLPILMQYFEQLRTIILDMQRKISLKMLGEDVPPCLSVVPSSWLRPSLEYPVADSLTKKQRTV